MIPSPADLAADLPPPRDDEPAPLRQDILDELGDHLACALDRERQRVEALGGGVAGTPERRVLERFGNPAQLALRLWWDAMREKIMTRRLVFGAALLMLVLGGTVAGLLFRQLLRQQAILAAFQERVTADARHHSEQLEQIRRESQETADRMVKAAETEVAAAEAARRSAEAARERMATRLEALEARFQQPADWNPAEVSLHRLSLDGPPAAGFRVRLGPEGNQNDIPPQEQVSGADGRVRFDRVRYGLYELRVTAPWKEVFSRTVRIRPGESYRVSMACPEAAPEPIQGRLRLQVPEDLKHREFWLSLNLQRVGRAFAGSEWTTRFGSLPGGSGRGGPAFLSAGFRC